MVAPARTVTPQQVWEFDTSGFLVVPALSTHEVQQCRRYAAAAAAAVGGDVDRRLKRFLHGHPTLRAYLDQLCFKRQSYHLGDEQPAYKLEVPLSPVQPAEVGAPLDGGAPPAEQPLDRSRDYVRVHGCHGVRVVWAIRDAPLSIALVPASHKIGLPTPSEVKRDGGRKAEGFQLMLQPVLKAGDLLLFASNLMHTVRPWATCDEVPTLFQCEYIAAMARHGLGVREQLLAEEQPPPRWWGELTAEQRAVMGVADNRELDCNVIGGHPSSHTLVAAPVLATAVAVDPLEQYRFDLTGYLLIKQAFNQELIIAANAGLDYASPKPRKNSRLLGPDAIDPTRCTDPAGGLLTLHHPHCLPFRELFAHREITSRLSWMMGDGFRCSGFPAGAIIMDSIEHNTGQELHGGNHFSVEGTADFHSYHVSIEV